MTTILTKKKDTSGAPVAGDLTNATGGAELAVNTADKRLYAKNSSNAVVEIGTNASELMVSGTATFRGAVSGNSTFNISGSAGLSGNVDVGGTLTGASTVSDQDGDLRDIPKSGTTKTDAYTFAIGDVGNHILYSSANVNFTVPASTFDTGDVISVISTNGATGTISAAVTTMFVAEGASATATATVGANGLCNLVFISASHVLLTGNVS